MVLYFLLSMPWAEDVPEDKESSSDGTETTQQDSSDSDEKTEDPIESNPKEEQPVETKKTDIKTPEPKIALESQKENPPLLSTGYEDGAPVNVTLINGDMLTGRMSGDTSQGKETRFLFLDEEVAISLPEAAIRDISYRTSKFRYEDSGATRYFYSPSAMPLKPKSGYISQKELLFTAVAYSPMENVSVLAGTSLPFMLFGLTNGSVTTTPLVAGVRTSLPVREKVYVGAGAEGFMFDGSNLVLPFVNATYGDTSSHVTIAGGMVVNDLSYMSAVPVSLSGYHRLTDRLAFVTENWAIFAPDVNVIDNYDKPLYEGPCFDYEICYEQSYETDWGLMTTVLFQSIGIRFISPKFTTDVGMVNILVDGSYLPIPWLDVAWHFGP